MNGDPEVRVAAEALSAMIFRLNGFTRHRPWCPEFAGPGDCTCGLYALLDSIRCTCGHKVNAHTNRDVSDVVGWPCNECKSERCRGFTLDVARDSRPVGEAVMAAFDAIEAACPVCGGDRWTVAADPSDESGQTPMQVQCWDAEHVVVAEQRALLQVGPAAVRPATEAQDLPDRVVVGANGAYWRDYGDAYSMCPVSDDNDPVVPTAIYVRDYIGWEARGALKVALDRLDAYINATEQSDDAIDTSEDREFAREARQWAADSSSRAAVRPVEREGAGHSPWRDMTPEEWDQASASARDAREQSR